MKSCLFATATFLFFNFLCVSVLGAPEDGFSDEITRETIFSVSGEIEAPFDVPAGLGIPLVIDRVLFDVDVSIAGDHEGTVFEQHTSSEDGTIQHSPELVQLNRDTYTVTEAYSGEFHFVDPFFRFPLAVLQGVKITRRLVVTQPTDYKVIIRALLKDFRADVVEGPLTISGGISGPIEDINPLILTTTQDLAIGDKIKFRVDFLAQIVSETRLEMHDEVPEQSRVFVDVTDNEWEEVVAKIKIENAANVFGFRVDLCYNPKILKPVDIELGNFLARDGGEIFWKSPSVERNDGVAILKGILATRLAPDRGVSGDGTLAKLQFKIKDRGISPLELKNVELLDESGNPIRTSVESTRALRQKYTTI